MLSVHRPSSWLCERLVTTDRTLDYLHGGMLPRPGPIPAAARAMTRPLCFVGSLDRTLNVRDTPRVTAIGPASHWTLLIV